MVNMPGLVGDGYGGSAGTLPLGFASAAASMSAW